MHPEQEHTAIYFSLMPSFGTVFFCVKSINIYCKRQTSKLPLRLIVFLQFRGKTHTRHKRLERVCLAAFRFYLAVSYITVGGHYKLAVPRRPPH